MLVKEILSEAIENGFTPAVQSSYRDIINSCEYIRYHKLFVNYKDIGDSLDMNDIQKNIKELEEIIKKYDVLSSDDVSRNTNLKNRKVLMDSFINDGLKKIHNTKPYPPLDYSFLGEDSIDFKEANGQVSAMSTNRPKTKKYTAKSEVEQLFKEDKK